MSLEAERAAWALVPHLERLLAVVPVKRRPSAERAGMLLWRLAWQHRVARGDTVDDTVPQLAESLGWKPDTTEAVLAAFHAVGLLAVVRHGGGGRGTIRRLAFLDPDALADLAGVAPARCDAELAGVVPELAGVTPDLAGVVARSGWGSPSTPTIPSVSHVPPTDGGDEVQLRPGEPGWAAELPEALRFMARAAYERDYAEGDVRHPVQWTAKWWRSRRFMFTEASCRWQPGMAAVLLDMTAALEAISERDVGALVVALEDGCRDCDTSLFGRPIEGGGER